MCSRSQLAVHIMLLVAVSAVCFASSREAGRRGCEDLNADAIFIGRMIEAKPTVHIYGDHEWEKWPGYSMRIAVEETLKGVLGREVWVEAGSNCGGCTPPFDPGERLL